MLRSAQVESCIFCLLLSQSVGLPTICIAFVFLALSGLSPGIFDIFCPCPPPIRPVEHSLRKCFRWWAGQWVGIEAGKRCRKCRDCIPNRAGNAGAVYVVGELADWDRSRLRMQRLNPRTPKNYRYNATVICSFQLSTVDMFAKKESTQ